jgi:hypothetical protein
MWFFLVLVPTRAIVLMGGLVRALREYRYNASEEILAVL